MSSTVPKLVSLHESRRFIHDCFIACNVPQTHAVQMADLLVNADYRKNFSYGINQLSLYISDLQQNKTDGTAVPIIITETPVIAVVDGNNGLGAVVGNFCMDLAIKKAKVCGIGWVCARHSNDYGMASWYPIKAMKEGLIGLSMSNTSPIMVPTRSKEAALGQNPLSMAVPSKNDKFILDMTTTVVSGGKIEIEKNKGIPIPKGWAQDKDGKITTDPERAYEALCLLPLGGGEETSGFKGYGLSALVDILSGVLSGASYSKKIKKWSEDSEGEANLGQLFIAIDPNFFAPNFEENMTDFNARLRCSHPIDSTKQVLVPGDKEEMCMTETDSAGGIEYSERELKIFDKMAKKLNIQPLKFDKDVM